MILLDVYTQVKWEYFQKICMGGNMSPLIVHLFLSCCEYSYMIKLAKTDYTFGKIIVMQLHIFPWKLHNQFGVFWWHYRGHVWQNIATER